MRILWSFVLLAGVSLVALAGTYAVFTDVGQATGTVMTSGVVDLKLTTGGPLQDNVTILWNTSCTEHNLGAGDVCHAGPIGVRNAGTLAFDYVFEVFVSPIALVDCFTVTADVSDDDEADPALFMAAGDEETFEMELTVVADPAPGCMGQTATVGLTLMATQAVGP